MVPAESERGEAAPKKESKLLITWNPRHTNFLPPE
jgi:hypothetical protein